MVLPARTKTKVAGTAGGSSVFVQADTASMTSLGRR